MYMPYTFLIANKSCGSKVTAAGCWLVGFCLLFFACQSKKELVSYCCCCCANQCALRCVLLRQGETKYNGERYSVEFNHKFINESCDEERFGFTSDFPRGIIVAIAVNTHLFGNNDEQATTNLSLMFSLLTYPSSRGKNKCKPVGDIVKTSFANDIYIQKQSASTFVRAISCLPVDFNTQVAPNRYKPHAHRWLYIVGLLYTIYHTICICILSRNR